MAPSCPGAAGSRLGYAWHVQPDPMFGSEGTPGPQEWDNKAPEKQEEGAVFWLGHFSNWMMNRG